jgi:CheY-like chemotaxis protein
MIITQVCANIGFYLNLPAMPLKICLLVTDDPDDHQAFSEAISDISEKAVLLVMLDSHKALHLLKEKYHSPDLIFLDLCMHGIRINSFLKIIREDGQLRSVPTIVYGHEASFRNIEQPDNLIFFYKDYEYSALKTFLKSFISDTTEST